MKVLIHACTVPLQVFHHHYSTHKAIAPQDRFVQTDETIRSPHPLYEHPLGRFERHSVVHTPWRFVLRARPDWPFCTQPTKTSFAALKRLPSDSPDTLFAQLTQHCAPFVVWHRERGDVPSTVPWFALIELSKFEHAPWSGTLLLAQVTLFVPHARFLLALAAAVAVTFLVPALASP